MVVRFKQQLGAALRRRRLELGLSQKDVAEAAHVKEPQTVSRWERGISMPSDLEVAAGALKTTVPELMAGIPAPVRVARKLDIAPADDDLPLREQLTRMEAKLDLLLSAGVVDALLDDQPAEVAADVVARLARAAGSPRKKAPPPRKSRAAAKRRRSA